MMPQYPFTRLNIRLTITLFIVATCCLPQLANAQPPSDPTVKMACVLIIDTSGSMKPIYDQVRETAVDIVEQFAPGDVVLLITFDRSATAHPPETILTPANAAALGEQIAGLVPDGSHTYIAGALEEGRIQADQLDASPLTERHAKLVLILTDGRNEPPPGVPPGMGLMDVAERYAGRPWYVWQIQLGEDEGEDIPALLAPHCDPDNLERTHVVDIEQLRSVIEDNTPSWITFAPQVIDLGPLEPGETVSTIVSYDRRPLGATARVWLENGGASRHISVEAEPGSWQSSPGESGEIRFVFEVPDDAPDGDIGGEVLASADHRSIRFSSKSIKWRGEVQESEPRETTRVELGNIDFGPVAPGASERRRIPVDVRAAVPGLMMSLSASQPSIAGVDAALSATDISFADESRRDVELTVRVSEDAALGEVTGEILVAFSGSPVKLPPATVMWTATIAEPLVLWPWLVGAVVVIGAILGLLVWRRRPVLAGTLTYWAPSGGEGRADLAELKVGIARVGSAEDAEIHLEESEATARLVATRIEGHVLVVVTPEGATDVVHDGREVTSLALYDRDEFQFGGYSFEYRGDVPVRPADESSEW